MRIKLLILCLPLFLMAKAHSAPPDWNVNPADFEMSANMTAQLLLDKEVVTGSDNQLGVFVADSCRGVATPLFSMDTWMYFITIYSNINNETMHFRAYIAELDTVLDVTETIVFEANATYGEPTDLFELNTYLNYDFPPVVSDIPDQTIYTGESFVPVHLPDYLSQTDDDSVFWSYRGYANLAVSIDSNYTATITPYFPQWTGTQKIVFTATEVTDNRLSASDTAVYTVLPPDHPPQILNIPDQTIGWLGTFETINLNEHLAEQDGDEVVWSYVFQPDSGNTDAPDWAVQPADFEMSMTLTAEVICRGDTAGAGDYVLGAFVPGDSWECRGVASPTNAPGGWLYFLTIYSNLNQDSIHFRLYDPQSGDILPVKQKYAFESNAAWGSPLAPVRLNAGYLLLEITETDEVQFDVIDSTWSGSEIVQFRVQDLGTLQEYADSAAVTFTVLPDHHPVVANIPDQTIEQGQAFNTFDLDDFLTERDQETVTWHSQGAANLSLQIDESNTVTVSSANPDWIGEEMITFIATDNTVNGLTGSDSALFTILPPDHPPQVTEIPEQTIGIGGKFSDIELDSFLVESDGDSVIWNVFFPESAEPVSAPDLHVQPNDFESSMTATTVIVAHGDTIDAGGHLLGAFVDDDCRGIASPANVMGKWLYFLTIYSNSDGEKISFKFYDANFQEIFPVAQHLVFHGNAAYGDPVQPYQMDAGLINLTIDSNRVASISSIDSCWTGTEAVQFIARDFGTHHQYADSQLVRFTVLEDDHNPLVHNIPDQTILQDGQFSPIQLNDYLTELDGDSVIWSAAGFVELSVEITGNVAQISVPAESWFGSEIIIFQASDVTAIGLSDTDTVQFTVERTVPVELISFSAEREGDGVRLSWSTTSETNNFGFVLQRKHVRGGEWQEITFLPGKGTTATPQKYRYSDKSLNPGNWYYRLQQQDLDGRICYSAEIEITVDLPTVFALSQNYPNPFNASTAIKYELPAGKHWVQLRIYDILGQQIKTLVDREQPAGYYQIVWDGTDNSGNSVSSGIYFYKLVTEKNSFVRRMVLIE